MFKILVVEDDKEIRDGIEIYLKSQGYEVLKAADGVEGLEVIYSNEIKAILRNLPKSANAIIFLSEIYLQNTPETIPKIKFGNPFTAKRVATISVDPVILYINIANAIVSIPSPNLDTALAKVWIIKFFSLIKLR